MRESLFLRAVRIPVKPQAQLTEPHPLTGSLSRFFSVHPMLFVCPPWSLRKKYLLLEAQGPSRYHSPQIQGSDLPCLSPGMPASPYTSCSPGLWSEWCCQGSADVGEHDTWNLLLLKIILYCFLSEFPSILYDRVHYLMSHSHDIFDGQAKVLCSTRDLQLVAVGLLCFVSGEGTERSWASGASITLSWGDHFILESRT